MNNKKRREQDMHTRDEVIWRTRESLRRAAASADDLEMAESILEIVALLRRAVLKTGDSHGYPPSFELPFGFKPQCAMAELPVSNEERNIRKLLDRLCERVQSERGEFKFQEIVDLCHADGLFEGMLDGRDVDGTHKLTAKAISTFGLMLGRYASKMDMTGKPYFYRKDANTVILFGYSGRGRGKRFFVEIRKLNQKTDI